MNIVAVDDEKLLLYELLNELEKVFPNADLIGFDEGEDALEYIEKMDERLDYAFLDIKLRGMTGIQLAKQIKDRKPEAKIIFCTAYSDYALEAYQVHAVGYIMKPVTEEKIREQLEALQQILRSPVMEDDGRLNVHTFGTFEVFRNGKPLVWEREKAKELLAYLIDRRGAAVSNAGIAVVLWEDDSKARNVQTILSSLRKTLKNAGCEDILLRARNATSIDVKKVHCDLYDFLCGNTLAINMYHGEYMEQYGWAENTRENLS